MYYGSSIYVARVIGFLLYLAYRLYSCVVQRLSAFYFYGGLQYGFLYLRDYLRLYSSHGFVSGPLVGFYSLVSRIMEGSSSTYFYSSPRARIVCFLRLVSRFVVYRVYRIVERRTICVLLREASYFRGDSLRIVASARGLSNYFRLYYRHSLYASRFVG